jgi:SAM-dependent methyltransferase
MGRRGVGVEDGDRWVFNRLAEDYRARPGYPAALVDRLVALTGGDGTVVDLGAGTGLLALPLARRGLAVRAVEPASAMLDVLRESGPGLQVDPVHAAAEETGLPDGSASLVLVADALHWIEPEAAGAEAARLLSPGGAVAVVEVRIRGSAFADGLSDLLARENPKARPRPRGRLDQFLAATGVRRRAAETYLDEQVLPPERLDSVLRSLSLVGPALGPDRLAGLLAEARRLAAAAGGATWTRELRLTWGRAGREAA